MIDFKNKKIAVLGAGVEGISSALFLEKQGARVTILDKKPISDIADSLGELGWSAEVKVVGGENYLDELNQYDIVVRSPGIKSNLPQILEAEKKGAVITSQIKLFFDFCPCPIIGVTGTKGKGTTSSLIFEMLKSQGFSVYLGGNIGEPPLNFLDKLNPQSKVVLELSSFQLQDLNKSPAGAKAMAGKPHIAVILMITSEHLDYHKDVKEYVEAKRNILRFQTANDFAVINRDYLASNESDIHTDGKVFFVSREREVKEGCFVKDGKIMLHYSGLSKSEIRNPKSETILNVQNLNIQKVSDLKNSNFGFVSSFDIRASNLKSKIEDIEIINIKDILLPGKHNLENVCAAAMASTLAGVAMENIIKVLKTFKGLEHRLELIAEINGVKYYDDSFSTTPETAFAAVEAFKEPEILILGGSSKGSDFGELGKVLEKAKNIKAVIGIGKEWQRMKSQFSIFNFQFSIIEGLKNMEEIVQKAAEVAEPGDVVLLSPACASFGMFKNYKDRGEQFKKEVLKLNF